MASTAGTGQPAAASRARARSSSPGRSASAVAVEQRASKIAGRVEQQPLDQIARAAARRAACGQQALPSRATSSRKTGGKGLSGRSAGESADADQARLAARSTPRRWLACIDDDRHTELLPSRGEIDLKAAMLGHVDHVQHDDGRQTQLQHLADQVEIALQVAGVDDRQHQRRSAASSSRRASSTSTATISSGERGARL